MHHFVSGLCHYLASANMPWARGKLYTTCLSDKQVRKNGHFKIKRLPECWCEQKPGKTEQAVCHRWKCSNFGTPPLQWSHSPKPHCQHPGSAQPSGLVRGRPQLPPNDTNRGHTKRPSFWHGKTTSVCRLSKFWILRCYNQDWFVVKSMTYHGEVEDFEFRVFPESSKSTQVRLKPLGITLNSLSTNWGQ